jgi:hypothetical protein
MSSNRFFVASAVLLGMMSFAGCSGTPAVSEQAAPASSTSSRAPDQASNTDSQTLTPERIMQLQREGYKLVNRDGETYFCRTETKTGSRLARETICMTEAEIASLRQQTKQGLGRVMRERPPPQGN